MFSKWPIYDAKNCKVEKIDWAGDTCEDSARLTSRVGKIMGLYWPGMQKVGLDLLLVGKFLRVTACKLIGSLDKSVHAARKVRDAARKLGDWANPWSK